MVSIWLLLFLINLLNHLINGFQDTSCNLNNTEVKGTCKSVESCFTIIDDIRNGKPYDICGYDQTVLIVCCPPKRPTSTTEGPSKRISELKCDEYKSAVYEYVQSISIFRDQDEWKRPVDKCGNRELTTNISYGEYAKPREFPHMGSLGFVNDENVTLWLCGVSLISDQYVLTASHCFIHREYGPPRYVRLGELNFDSQFDDAQPEDFEIAKLIPHPNYKYPAKYNDIALIRLNRKVTLNPYKRPLCLPTMNEEESAEHAVATGWGKSNYFNGDPSVHLIKVTLDKFSHEECEKLFRKEKALKNGISVESHICYGSKTDERDTCQGDSGGPLQIFHPTNYCMYTIIGITSFGKACGLIGIPGVYTRVSAYVEWIESIVWRQNTSCNLNNTEVKGTCKSVESCFTIIDDIRNGKPYDICGYDQTVLIVCCPPKRPTSTTEGPSKRISELKCDEYKSAVYEYVQSISIFRDQDEWKRPVDKCGNRELTTNISYGEYAQPREFPHMGSLGFVNNENVTLWLCGVSLISDQYVLTAGHCFSAREYGPPRYVRLGELNFESQFDDARPEDFEIAEIIPHPNYKSPAKYNDIALMRLNRKVTLNPYKRPLCLPTMNEEESAEHAIATGWGKPNSKGTESSVHLIKVTLDKFSHEECYKEHQKNRHLQNGISIESQICYGSKTDERDTCQGDSGGPLQIFHPTNYCMYTIIGITSFGKACGFMGIPGIYTRVSAYVEWIESIVWRQSTSCTLNNGKTEGICKSIESCPFIIDDIQKGRLYEICGYDKTVLIVCCPSNFSTTTEAPNTRISERKCDEYKEAVYEYVESVSIFRNEEIYKRKVDKCGNRNLTTDLPYGEYSHGREFPHMASLGFVNKRNQTKWFCGASLISEQYVLTAAHCLHIDEYGPVQYVRLGELNFESVFDDAKPEDFEIAEHISHPNYTEELYYNDIALIKLKRAVKLNPYKRPACLPSIIEEPPKYAIATGWGHDKFGGKRSTHLIKVTLEKFSSDICFENFKDVLYSLNRGTPNETQICYGSNDGRDTCTGDSGGPLQAFHPEFHCMYTIYGITSLGIGCGFIGVPAVYTRVSAYIDWIESVVWKGS